MVTGVGVVTGTLVLVCVVTLELSSETLDSTWVGWLVFTVGVVTGAGGVSTGGVTTTGAGAITGAGVVSAGGLTSTPKARTGAIG